MSIYTERMEKVKSRLQELGLQGVILFPSPNLYYLTGFHTFPGERLLISILPVEGEPFFFAPKLYESQIRQDTEVAEIITWTDEENAYDKLRVLMERKGLLKGKYAIDDTTWAVQLLGMMAVLPQLEFAPMGNLLASLRLLKTADEIEKIREASRIVDTVIEAVRKTIQPGMTEIELAAFMEFEMRKAGSAGPSFETIVGSGPNSALPHYSAGERRFQNGDFVVLDFGAIYQGYCSDTTRTLCIGTPTARMAEVYQIVKEAQELGVRTVKPGIKASEVDNAVRQYITEHGYGEYFTHRTGHGLGLEVHEDPYISGISEMILQPGMVFSIEPGIYLEGEFGVRIEDIVVVTETGCERLNHFSRELTVSG